MEPPTKNADDTDPVSSVLEALPARTFAAVSKAFHVDDPIMTQNLLSYSFSSEDDWKVDSWKSLFLTASVVYRDFSFTLHEVQLLGDAMLKQMKTLYVMPVQTVCDVGQALLNVRYLLRRESVLCHVAAAWNPGARAQHFRRVLSEPLKPVEVLQSATGGMEPLGLVYRAVTGSAALLSVGLMRMLGGKGSRREYTAVEERHIPYVEPMTQQSPAVQTEVLHVGALQCLADAFFTSVKSGSLSEYSGSARGLVNTPTPSLDADHRSRVVLLLTSVASFLTSRIRASVTHDDVSIFVWYLAFFSRSPSCQPFECSLEPGCEDSTARTVQGIRIVWDDFADHGHRSPSDKESTGSLPVTAEDRARLLELFAETMLTDRLALYESRAVAADAECRKLLALQRRDGALVWLKKKKLFQTEIQKLEAQLLRLDEARHMRDASLSVGLVASVIQTTLETTRFNLSETSRLAHTVNTSLQQSRQDAQEVQQLFEQLNTLGSTADANLEDEYAQLLAEERLEADLESVEVPKHPVQQRSAPTEDVCDKTLAALLPAS